MKRKLKISHTTTLAPFLKRNFTKSYERTATFPLQNMHKGGGTGWQTLKRGSSRRVGHSYSLAQKVNSPALSILSRSEIRSLVTKRKAIHKHKFNTGGKGAYSRSRVGWVLDAPVLGLGMDRSIMEVIDEFMGFLARRRC